MNTFLIPHGAKRKIAEAADVSQNTVSSWFTGKHPVRRNREKAIAAITSVLGFCPDFIVKGSRPNQIMEMKESNNCSEAFDKQERVSSL